MNWQKLHKLFAKFNHTGVVGAVLIALTTLLFFGCSPRPESKRILFIGNSYTYRNNMPLLFQEIAKSKGYSVDVTAITRGKYTFYLQAQRKIIKRVLKHHTYDVIVLQGSSMDLLWDSSRLKSRTFPAIEQLITTIRTYQPQSKLYLYMTWAYGIQDSSSGKMSYSNQMLEALDQGYRNLKKKFNVPVIPVGKVWANYLKKYPQVVLYTQDCAHPSFVGSYLVAGTMFQAIYGKPLKGAPTLTIRRSKEIKTVQDFVTEQFQTPEIKSYLVK
ncbi:MAG TPA: SGNH/GDSL hydrolase family protein [Cytophagaceae bacterium]